MEILNPNLESRGLTFFLQGIGHLFLDLFHHVLDPAWMDAAVGQQTLQCQPGNLTADRVKARNNDSFWRIVNNEVDTCGSFKGANITPFTTNDPAFHLLARQCDDRNGAFY